MRSDWPAGFNEDCIEPPCEIFLQLFIENPDGGVGDIVIQDDEISLLDEISQYEPMALNDTDSDHGDDFPIDFNVDDASSDFLSIHSDLSMHIVSVSSDTASESSGSDTEVPEESSGAEPHCEETSDTECGVSGTSDTSSELSVGDAETHEELSGAELQCKETASKLSDEEASRDTWLHDEIFPVEECPEENAGGILEIDCSPLTAADTEHNEEASSNVPYEDTGNCAIISPLSNELPNQDEPPQVLEPSSGSSSTSTYVSLYVVVPPTNFPNEDSATSLSGHSSSSYFSGLIPVCQPYSTNPFKPFEIPPNDSHEICTCVEEMIALSKLATHNATSVTCDNQSSNSVLVPDSDTDNSDYQVSLSKSESKVSDDMDLEISVSDSNQSENTGLENEACSETFTDKSVIQKKRKVSTSGEDNVINKVPKYSSETSTDAVNVQESVENYCKVLSNNSEKQMPNDADRADIVPPAVAGDNVILTLGKAVEESSVINEKPKSR